MSTSTSTKMSLRFLGVVCHGTVFQSGLPRTSRFLCRMEDRAWNQNDLRLGNGNGTSNHVLERGYYRGTYHLNPFVGVNVMSISVSVTFRGSCDN